MMPMPSTSLGLMPPDMDIGVAPIPGPDGGESTFVGGDVIGIGEHHQERRRGLGLPVLDASATRRRSRSWPRTRACRSAPTSPNKYSAEDPRMVLINGLVAKGKTPYAQNFSATFNDPQARG